MERTCWIGSLGALALAGCAPEAQLRTLADATGSGPALPMAAPRAPGVPDPPRPSAVLAAPEAAACPGTGGWLFEDVAECAGLSEAIHILGGGDLPNAAGRYATGQAWLDLDGDTWLDLVVTSYNGWNRVFLGSPDGQLHPSSQPELVGVAALSAVPADLDGDGQRDLVIGGPSDQAFRNDGGVLVRIDGPDDPRNTLGLAFADLNHDGLPEAFATNWDCIDCEPHISQCETSRDVLWSASGGTWIDQTDQALGTTDIPTCGLGFTSVFGDYDNDGDLDLYVGNDKGSQMADHHGELTRRNTYWRNEGAGCGAACFTEHANTNGSAAWLDTMGVDTADWDDDGDLDLLMSDAWSAVLLENQGDGTFVDITEDVGLAQPLGQFGWGIVWVDHDNDGDLDIYVGVTGTDVFYRNDGGHYTDVRDQLPAAEGDTRGVAAADYDRDGRIDLITGDVGGRYRLLRNTTATGNHWLGLRLVGSGAGGTDALGARVWITDSSGRTQLREVKSGSSNGGGSDLGLHFGFGQTVPEHIRIRWPDGTEQDLEPAVDAWAVAHKPQ